MAVNPTEKQIQASVLAHWRAFGLPRTLVCAIPNARAFGQPGLHKGLFDLLVIGGNQIRFLELKADKGKLSDAQYAFKSILFENSIEYAVTYGRDQPIEVLASWGIVRSLKQERAA